MRVGDAAHVGHVAHRAAVDGEIVGAFERGAQTRGIEPQRGRERAGVEAAFERTAAMVREHPLARVLAHRVARRGRHEPGTDPHRVAVAHQRVVEDRRGVFWQSGEARQVGDRHPPVAGEEPFEVCRAVASSTQASGTSGRPFHIPRWR